MNQKQREKMADICVAMSQVYLGSLVVPAAFLDRVNWPMVVLGLTTTFFFWVLSILLVKE